MNSFRFYLAAVFLAAAFAVPAPIAAAPAKPSSIPFLGEKPGDAAIKAKLITEIRQFPAGERDALLEIVLLCELNRATLARKRLYDAWDKRCEKVEAVWNNKYRTADGRRLIDAQMRLYHTRKLSLLRVSRAYFAQKETIALKIKRREDVSEDVKAALRQRRELFKISGRILKFFFALKDLFVEARRPFR